MKPASPPKNQDIINLLKEMESLEIAYPVELLSARRAAFVKQVTRLNPVEVEETVPAEEDQEVIQLLAALTAVGQKYPPQLLAARRSAYVRRITWMNWMSPWITLGLAVKEGLSRLSGLPWVPSMMTMRTSLVIASLALAVWAGYLLSGNGDRQTANRLSDREGTSKPVAALVNPNTPEVIIDCKDGYKPPLCLTGEFKNTQDLTLPENGSARPAVAKDTIPGLGGVHRASHVNDGLYGPGASWVSNSRDSWIKIDLGKATPVNTVAFGRDRLGKLNDGDPGQFVIALAMSDDVYANGVSSNDEQEYTPVYDSEQAGFTGDISGAETVTAQFDPHPARFIKITFENEGTAIDEIEVFLLQPPLANNNPDRPSKDDSPEKTNTPLPTRTSIPSSTPTSAPTLTPLPTNTPVPTDTPTIPPTLTPIPTDTAVPPPTSTSVPMETETPDSSFTPFLPFLPTEITATPVDGTFVPRP